MYSEYSLMNKDIITTSRKTRIKKPRLKIIKLDFNQNLTKNLVLLK